MLFLILDAGSWNSFGYFPTLASQQYTHSFIEDSESLTWHTSAVWEMTIENPTPFDWIAILKLIWGIIAAIPTVNELRKILLDFLRRLYWKKKHGKSTTPVVIKRFLAPIFSYFKL